jgi:hypothetical protein
MLEHDILVSTKGAYLCLIHPVRLDEGHRQAIASIVALAPSVSDELVVTMIEGVSWRERLLGLCLAMTKPPLIPFTESMLQSLRDPRGISVVPTCAALVVLAQDGAFTMAASFSDMFDRTAFDGEVGWAVDKAMHTAGMRSEDVPGCGPTFGQIFEDHVEVYRCIRAGKPW